jgi:hypothetical protein
LRCRQIAILYRTAISITFAKRVRVLAALRAELAAAAVATK